MQTTNVCKTTQLFYSAVFKTLGIMHLLTLETVTEEEKKGITCTK